MKYKNRIEQCVRLADPYRVAKGKNFRLQDYNPADTGDIKSKEQAEEIISDRREWIGDLQEKLYAQDRWALLMIFQGMDAAGKDSVIKHVMTGVNPQGCDVYSFKRPSPEELNHDYLWRIHSCVPERGKIGIFNRSYYEEVLVARLHRDVLEEEKLPDSLVTKSIWKHRFQDINAFERYLTRNGVVILKFFLHLSKGEQRKRFLARLDDPNKNWKFSADDAKERGFWSDYQDAYEEMIQNTASDRAPWYVVPADNKWFTHLVVGSSIIVALAGLGLAFPAVDQAKRKELDKIRRTFERKEV